MEAWAREWPLTGKWYPWWLAWPMLSVSILPAVAVAVAEFRLRQYFASVGVCGCGSAIVRSGITSGREAGRGGSHSARRDWPSSSVTATINTSRRCFGQSGAAGLEGKGRIMATWKVVLRIPIGILMRWKARHKMIPLTRRPLSAMC